MVGDDTSNGNWGNWVARRTFIYTMVGAFLFIAAVFIWIL